MCSIDVLMPSLAAVSSQCTLIAMSHMVSRESDKKCMYTQYSSIPRAPWSVKSSVPLQFQSWLSVVGGGAVLKVKLAMLICH